MSEKQSDNEVNVWPPAIAEGHRVGVKNHRLYPEFVFAIAINIAIGLLNITVILAPVHSAIDVEPLVVPPLIVVGVGILIGIPVSIWRFCICLKKQDKWIQPVVTLLLSITPLPLDTALFNLLVHFKHLSIISDCGC